MGQPDLYAQVEYIDPLEHPVEYGGAELLADLRNLAHVEGDGPPLHPDLASALRNSDLKSAQKHIAPVREWLSRPGRYRVIATGTLDAPVPMLAVAAPDVADVELTATQSAASSANGEVSLKIAGTGMGASVKLTITDTVALTCARGEELAAYVVVPLYWERRSMPDNEDYNWMYVGIRNGRKSFPIVIRKPGHALHVPPLNVLTVDNRGGGSRPAALSKSYALEMGSDFTFGLKVETVGIDTSLKISANRSLTTELKALLPSGHEYQVAWLGGPWGVQVTTRQHDHR
jgi:hypothetical protein